MRTLVEQAAAVARGDVSPVELVEEALRLIEVAEDRYNAFTTVLPDRALDEAKRLTDADSSGPLHGVPIVVKDLYDIREVPTTGCCAAYADRVAAADAAVVESLREAGAIIVAKTNQHELAFGATNLISAYGPTRNPWDATRITGGSSGGSGAAVAARAVLGALGSDTGGSIRVPSSFCGVTGLKPTHGAVSLRGVMPLAPTLDTAGPLAVSAEDCLAVFRAILGFDPDDPYSVDGRPAATPETVERLRIALPRSFFDLLTPEVRTSVEAAAGTLEALGCVIDEIAGPDPDEAWQAIGYTTPAECAHHHPGLSQDERVNPETRELIALGAQASADLYLTGRDLVRKLRRDFEWALTAADAMLAPCTPFPAPRTDEQTTRVEGGELEVHRVGILRLTAPANVAGLPALAFPVGFSPDGLPLGAQLIGRPWSEEVLGALAAAYQTATDWHLRAPPA